ncbi:hypothetical protein CSKR_111311 [Clonorchis sinensis]|uniref:Uncharacterized protein n=1 Tax=Clonorchis sinensis TaxID=79923 RepID=A0A419PCS3_CLOSI|nr:hypothetical protein CSKR_111311 [Clonorchis sinensis]
MLPDMQSLNTPLTIQGEVLDIVEPFTYFGSCISSDCSVTDEQGDSSEFSIDLADDTPELEITQWLGRQQFTDRKVCGSNSTSASQVFPSRLGQPGSILPLTYLQLGFINADADDPHGFQFSDTLGLRRKVSMYTIIIESISVSKN